MDVSKLYASVSNFILLKLGGYELVSQQESPLAGQLIYYYFINI